MQAEIQHPFHDGLIFQAIYFPQEKATGERGYSLGTPPEPETLTIQKIFWRDNDITEFVEEFCDHRIYEWQEELLTFKREGRLSEF